MAGDRATLASLWSQDGVMMAPGSPALRGEELLAVLQAETDDAGYEALLQERGIVLGANIYGTYDADYDAVLTPAHFFETAALGQGEYLEVEDSGNAVAVAPRSI